MNAFPEVNDQPAPKASRSAWRLWLASFLLTQMTILLPIVACLPSSAQKSAGQLSVSLKTNKPMYRPHDEIIFSETIKNCGKDTIYIYDDTCYYGDDVKFKRISDGKESWDITSSDPHTVETGLRPSRNVLLKPGEELKRSFSAFVTDDFRVAFQSHGPSSFSGFSYGRQGGLDLPAKFVGCGRIFNLGQPGSYLVTTEYRNETQWSNGGLGLQPKQPAWIGHVRSNPVSLDLKK
jgi:hypothetical protein